jgi:hypothetical protein
LPDFQQLKAWREDGFNLAIHGYDAFPMKTTKEDIEQTYLNPKEPFGHERVLMSMLCLKEEEYPWRIYKTFEF